MNHSSNYLDLERENLMKAVHGNEHFVIDSATMNKSLILGNNVIDIKCIEM